MKRFKARCCWRYKIGPHFRGGLVGRMAISSPIIPSPSELSIWTEQSQPAKFARSSFAQEGTSQTAFMLHSRSLRGRVPPCLSCAKGELRRQYEQCADKDAGAKHERGNGIYPTEPHGTSLQWFANVKAASCSHLEGRAQVRRASLGTTAGRSLSDQPLPPGAADSDPLAR